MAQIKDLNEEEFSQARKEAMEEKEKRVLDEIQRLKDEGKVKVKPPKKIKTPEEIKAQEDRRKEKQEIHDIAEAEAKKIFDFVIANIDSRVQRRSTSRAWYMLGDYLKENGKRSED